MVAWCRGGGKCVQIYIDVGEGLVVDYHDVIVLMSKMDIK